MGRFQVLGFQHSLVLELWVQGLGVRVRLRSFFPSKLVRFTVWGLGAFGFYGSEPMARRQALGLRL